ncbi:MAG: metallophosphoesterase, partial [Actinobacteria bacterium]|nr:metallophosphoesterase [Actinomycetota bacterium]
MHSATKVILGTVGTAVAGAAALVYARWEAQQYTLRHATVAALPAG